MTNFYTDVIAKDARFHSTERISDMGLLEPFTRQAVMAIQLQAKAKGITLIVLETYRSQARQESLYEQKLTRLRSVGVHHYGLACDLARMKDGTLVARGSIDWTESDYEFLAEMARHNGMISGLDWGHPERTHTFIDADHLQRCAVKDQPALFAGTFYPNATYDPYR